MNTQYVLQSFHSYTYRQSSLFLLSTGNKPHKCSYDGCEVAFGDPAHKHRHMKAAHGHVPKTYQKLSNGPSPCP